MSQYYTTIWTRTPLVDAPLMVLRAIVEFNVSYLAPIEDRCFDIYHGDDVEKAPRQQSDDILAMLRCAGIDVVAARYGEIIPTDDNAEPLQLDWYEWAEREGYRKWIIEAARGNPLVLTPAVCETVQKWEGPFAHLVPVLRAKHGEEAVVALVHALATPYEDA